jgi:hypothetical protein
MNLTFAEDFTSQVTLDSQLLGTPDSGLYWNRGVHPVLTINNLLAFLPVEEFTFSAWNIATTYTKFNDSRKRSDIVLYDDKVYQSLVDSNTGNQPDTSSTQWLETNIESLRIKSFIWTVEDNALSALAINRKLIENQYIYNINETRTLRTNSSDYLGWAFEPKGSDYVKIRINQIALEANTAAPQSLYVVNQGVLIDTLTLNPQNGRLVFENIGYSFSGIGTFYFLIDGQDFYSSGGYNDPLKYKGFVCYPVIGTGAAPESSDFSYSSSANGLNFNVSCRLDSSLYVENNEIDLAKFYQAQFEYDYIRTVLHNANNRSNIDERLQKDGFNNQLLATESLNIDMATVAKNYMTEKKIATESINSTFDRFLKKRKGFNVKRKVL